MKLPAILFVACVLLVLNAAGVESRYHNWYNMFVFGDSFADNGNLPKTGAINETTRQWYYPYGLSIKHYHGSTYHSNGRFSNYLIEPDFIAKMLRLGLTQEAPKAYERGFGHMHIPHFGMTFAAGYAGVLPVPEHRDVPTLRQQIDTFERLVREGTIARTRLPDSVLLIAMSGNDYMSASTSNMTDLVGNVTAEIAANVRRLQKLGAAKIMVNNMHPFGCTPRYTRSSNYASCYDRSNMVASVHNSNLNEKLGADSSEVHIVDLNTAFKNVLADSSNRFTHKLAPCCEAKDPKGYCGQISEAGPLYSICDHIEQYFYFDEMNPTYKGWKAVMKQVEGPIKDFLKQD